MLPEVFRRAGRPAVLGHRGSPRERPENTLDSFRLALTQGADGVELDVMRCASGEVVVVHDPNLSRLAGRPLEVRKTPWSALRGLDVGSHLDPRFSSARLPLLSEVLEALPSQTLINVELKGQEAWLALDLGLPAEVARILSRAAARERFLVSSFNPFLLLVFRSKAPDIAAALLFGEGERPSPRRSGLARMLRLSALNPSLAVCEARALRRWKERGYGLCVWTVDDPAVAIALHRRGVDCVITNVPARVSPAFA